MKKIAVSCRCWTSPLVLAAILLLSGDRRSGAQEGPSPTLRETTTVTVIEVPVIVLRDGAPVRGLAAADFELFQDGAAQSITGFESVDLTTSRSVQQSVQAMPTSLAGRRYFLLAFDLSHTQPSNARRAVVAARNLVGMGLHPTDLVGVSVYSAVAGARLLNPFTSDRAQLDAALLAVEAVTSRDEEVIRRARAILAS